MLINADCFEALKDLADNSIEAVVTDPPYGLGACTPAQVAECLQAWSSGKTWKPKGSGFMGKAWDAWVPPPELWREVLRVLKPGGHALVFAGSRTQDLMGMSLRLAGFEMRDVIQWLYGSGFPKSHDVSKALDKMGGRQYEAVPASGVGFMNSEGEGWNLCHNQLIPVSEQTEEAKQWEGWGTALKPAYEPALLVRKPLSGTVAQNTLDYGCGGLNIDGCRIETSDELGRASGEWLKGGLVGGQSPRWNSIGTTKEGGRWPANVILDEQASEQLEQQAGSSRFFYTAKPSASERHAGIRAEGERANVHPTVKPIDLMRYLIRLVTPPHGTVLDPFMGSGSTGCAAALEGVSFIGIEREPEYFAIAQQRVAYWGGDVEALEYPPESKPEQSDTLPLFDWLDG
jgi:site-specific DNA-methyltransferase (adenine-specific)